MTQNFQLKILVAWDWKKILPRNQSTLKKKKGRKKDT